MALRRLRLFVAVVSTSALIVACTSPAPAPPAGAAGASGPSGAAAISCVASSAYTVLQVGKTPASDAKKVADNCWWQFPVEDVHGFVGYRLGWQLCNACDVDVEFRLSDLPSSALAACNFYEASGETQRVVPHGQILPLDCQGLQAAHDDFTASARLAGSTGAFIASDPELEIEDVNLAPDKMARLAVTVGLTRCMAPPAVAGGKRVRISGSFTRMNASSSIVLIPSGPGFLTNMWGADLIEFAMKDGALLSPAEASAQFTVTTDLPGFVTDFALRTGGGLAATLRTNDAPPCP